MQSLPSKQTLNVEVDLIATKQSHPELVKAIESVFRNSAEFAMNRRNPDEESDARKEMLTKFRQVDAASMPEKRSLEVDEYLSGFEQRAAQNGLGKFQPFGEFMLAKLNSDQYLFQRTNLILERPIEPILVCFDETEHWNKNAKEVVDAGKIFSTYLVDTSSHTHLCEATPSYYLEYLYTTPMHDDEEGTIHSFLMANTDLTDANTYMHVSTIENLDNANKEPLQRRYLEVSETYDEAMESEREYYCANVRMDIPANASDAMGMRP